MEKTTQYLAGGGLLAAIAAVLQLVGSAIRLGPCAAGRPSTTRICCCVACGSTAPLTAHRQISPEKRSRYKREAGDYESPASFFLPHHRESRLYGKNTRTAHAAAMKAAASAASAAGMVWRVRRMPAAP